MSRIQPRERRDYPWYLRFLYWVQKKQLGAPLEPMLIMGRTPAPMLCFVLLFKSLTRKKSPLHPQLRGLVQTRVSQIYECSFCIDMNSLSVLKHTHGEAKLKELHEFATSLLYNAQEKAALKYAEASLPHPPLIDDAIFQELQQHFTDDAIIELTMLIGFQKMSCTVNTALDIHAYGFCEIFRANNHKNNQKKQAS